MEYKELMDKFREWELILMGRLQEFFTEEFSAECKLSREGNVVTVLPKKSKYSAAIFYSVPEQDRAGLLTQNSITTDFFENPIHISIHDLTVDESGLEEVFNQILFLKKSLPLATASIEFVRTSFMPNIPSAMWKSESSSSFFFEAKSNTRHTFYLGTVKFKDINYVHLDASLDLLNGSIKMALHDTRRESAARNQEDAEPKIFHIVEGFGTLDILQYLQTTYPFVNWGMIARILVDGVNSPTVIR